MTILRQPPWRGVGLGYHVHFELILAYLNLQVLHPKISGRCIAAFRPTAVNTSRNQRLCTTYAKKKESRAILGLVLGNTFSDTSKNCSSVYGGKKSFLNLVLAICSPINNNINSSDSLRGVGYGPCFQGKFSYTWYFKGF
jgi:hypothetical protein